MKDHWTREELNALSPEERVAASEVIERRQNWEYEQMYGPFRPESIGVRKGELPTITTVISTPEP